HLYSTPPSEGESAVYARDCEPNQKLAQENREWSEKLHPEYDCRPAEVIWPWRGEMAASLADFLPRRHCPLVRHARAALQRAAAAAKVMAQELGKPEDWIQNELKEYKTLVDRYLLSS